MSSAVVPWFNYDEWFAVYNRIYGEPNDHSEAFQDLLVWKTRTPSLPSGIESTLGLLLVLHQDIKSSTDSVQLNIMKLAYSAAIIRFVNHMLDSQYAKGTSLYKAAQISGVPEWIIDLRHETAHGTTLPTVELFREASFFALRWLQRCYWDKHKNVLMDYQSGLHPEIQEDEETIRAMFQFYLTLSFCLNSANIRKISDIGNTNEMKNQLLSDIKELFGDSVDLTNADNITLESLLKLANEQFKKYVKFNNCGAIAAKTLVNEESIFMSLELVKILGLPEYNANYLGDGFVLCFEVILVFLHTTNLLGDLILELIEVTRHTEHTNEFRRLAALWLSQIFRALNKTKTFTERILNISSYKNMSNYINDKFNDKLLFRHLFPNMADGLFLNLQKSVPKEFTQLSFIQPIISTYNPYLTFFIKDLLVLLKPQLPQSNINKICKLANLISTKSNLQKVPFKIYTVVDLQASEATPDAKLDSDIEIVEKSDEEEMIVEPNVNEETIWKLAPKNYNWSACPIGVLPWHAVGRRIYAVNIER